MASRRARAPRSSAEAEAPAPSAPAPLPELPEAAVACILQHVPLRERLTRTALVCRAWAAAAAAVPTDVSARLKSSEHCGQLQDWLAKHGGVVVRLVVRSVAQNSSTGGTPWPKWRPLQLPTPKLTQLRVMDVEDVRVQLMPGGVSTRSTRSSRGVGSSVTGSSSSSTSTSSIGSAAGALPQLQELRLSHCCVTEQLASQLLSSSTLSSLHWGLVRVHNSNWTRRLKEQVLPKLWRQLQLLPNLSELQLSPLFGTLGAELTPVSTLQGLQSLHLSLPFHTDVSDVLAVVPAGLTALHASAFDTWNVRGNLQAELSATRLASLQRMCVAGLGISSTLSIMTGLQELQVHRPVYAGGWGVTGLLAALQHLTQLQALCLSDCQLHLVDEQQEQQQQPAEGAAEEGASCQCFSAITASPQLTALVLTEWGDMPVPLAAFDHMFPAGRVLPNLKVLSLNRTAGLPDQPCVEAAQVARIAASCPALQKLGLVQVTQRGFDTSCLLQLPPGVTSVNGLGWSRPGCGAAAI